MHTSARIALTLLAVTLIFTSSALPVSAQMPDFSQIPGLSTIQQVVGSLFGSRAPVVPQPAENRPQVLYGSEILITTPVAGDLIVAGGRVSIDAPVAGDLIVAGGLVQINSDVAGDVLGVAGLMNVASTVANDVRVAGIGVNLDSTIAKNAMIATGFLRQSSRSTIAGSLMAYAYRSWLNGTIGGNLDLKGTAVVFDAAVGGNATFNADNLTIQRNANVLENTSATLLYQPVVDVNAKLVGPVDLQVQQVATESSIIEATVSAEPTVEPVSNEQSFWPLVGRVHAQEAAAPASTQLRKLFASEVQDERQDQAFEEATRSFFGPILIMLAGGSFMLWLFPRFQRGQAMAIVQKPGATLAAGFLWLFMGVIVSVLLMITIIGIPLGIALLLIWIANMMIAPWAVAQAIGGMIGTRGAAKTPVLASPYMQLLIGAVILSTLMMLPMVGWLVRSVVVVLGMGATVYWLMNAQTLQPAPVVVVATTKVVAAPAPAKATKPASKKSAKK